MQRPTTPSYLRLLICAALSVGMVPAGIAAPDPAATPKPAKPAKPPKPPASDGTARAMCKSALVAKSYGEAWKGHDVAVESTKAGKTVTGRMVKGKKSFEYICHTNPTGKVIDLTIGPMVAAR